MTNPPNKMVKEINSLQLNNESNSYTIIIISLELFLLFI